MALFACGSLYPSLARCPLGWLQRLLLPPLPLLPLLWLLLPPAQVNKASCVG